MDFSYQLGSDNIREEILTNIPSAYGSVKVGTPLYDLIQSISNILADAQNEIVKLREENDRLNRKITAIEVMPKPEPEAIDYELVKIKIMEHIESLKVRKLEDAASEFEKALKEL